MNYLHKHIILFVLTLIGISTLMAHDDSTLYVKTIYQHELVNGRNTARKFAIKQEMRNSDNVLFREVFYNKETKQTDYVLYYFYNKNMDIRLIEKTNPNDEVIEYFLYKYKKNKIASIEHYNYNSQKAHSKLISTKKYSYKKGIERVKQTDANNNLIKTEETTYRNKQKTAYILTDFLSDSINITAVNYEIVDSKIQSTTTTYTLKNKDTHTNFDEYIYDNNGNIKQINTYEEEDKENPVLQTKFKYFSGGSMKDKQVIENKTFFLEHLSVTLKVYYRELPIKSPVF